MPGAARDTESLIGGSSPQPGDYLEREEINTKKRFKKKTKRLQHNPTMQKTVRQYFVNYQIGDRD